MRFLLIFSFWFVLLTALDIYVFQAVKTAGQAWQPGLRKLVHLLYWGYYITVPLMFASFMFFDTEGVPRFFKTLLLGLFATVFFCKLIVATFLLFEDSVRLFNWVFPFGSGQGSGTLMSRRQLISTSALITAAIPFTASVYGMLRTAYNYKIHRVPLVIDGIPEALKGLKIVQFSDLHSGSFANARPVERAVRAINELEPDLIFFTGDMVNDRSVEVETVFEALSGLKARLGMYSVLGNHDYGDYVYWPNKEAKQANLQRLLERQQQMGFKPLMNSHELIEVGGASLAVMGVENWSAKGHFPKYGRLSDAISGAESADVRLLLSHDPSHWDAEVRQTEPRIDAMFAGHTHGFQFGIENRFIKWSPAKLLYEQWAGLYEKGDRKLYVNRGLGFLGYPGRIGIQPEITLFELA